MMEFFRGWRRKVGMLTLVMALVFMAGWVRSFGVCDEVRVSSSDRSYHLMFSSPGWIGWIAFHDPEGVTPAVFRRFYLRRSPIGNGPFDLVYTHWDSKTNQFNESFDNPNPHLLLPYWAVVAPLTLISLWLLLSKPLKSNQMKLPEPTRAEGA